MSDDSAIEWTDATWNPVRGCTKVSPGCKHCYAETFAERFRGVPGHPYEQGFDPRLVPEALDLPLRWTKPRTIFVDSMSDLFQTFVPDEYIAACFGVMTSAPRHVYQILTKRAERLPRFFAWIAEHGPAALAAWATSLSDPAAQARAHQKDSGDRIFLHAAAERALGLHGREQKRHVPFYPHRPWPEPQIHLGVSVEDRRYGLPRIDHLRRTPAALRFLSIEPLLEELGEIDLTGIGWVIIGGESGPGARECNLAWIRCVVAQADAQGVPVFVKQLGAHPVGVGAPVRLRRSKGEDAKGGGMQTWPADLAGRRAFPRGMQ